MPVNKLQVESRNVTFDEGKIWEIGESVFIRTVTYHVVGKIRNVIEKNNKSWLILENASWVADSGRFTQSIDDGQLNEVEPVSVPIRVNTDAIVDVYSWFHPLPDKQK